MLPPWYLRYSYHLLQNFHSPQNTYWNQIFPSSTFSYSMDWRIRLKMRRDDQLWDWRSPELTALVTGTKPESKEVDPLTIIYNEFGTNDLEWCKWKSTSIYCIQETRNVVPSGMHITSKWGIHRAIQGKGRSYNMYERDLEVKKIKTIVH